MVCVALVILAMCAGVFVIHSKKGKVNVAVVLLWIKLSSIC